MLNLGLVFAEPMIQEAVPCSSYSYDRKVFMLFTLISLCCTVLLSFQPRKRSRGEQELTAQKPASTKKYKVIFFPTWNVSTTKIHPTGATANAKDASVLPMEVQTKCGSSGHPYTGSYSSCPKPLAGRSPDPQPEKSGNSWALNPKSNRKGTCVLDEETAVNRSDMLNGCPKNYHERKKWLDSFVSPPWTKDSLRRSEALRELRQANPLWQHLGCVSLQGFYAFMVERELVRIRRCELKWPQEWWTGYWVIQRIRLTNVKRFEDAGSKRVAKAVKDFEERWATLNTDSKVWGKEQLLLAGDLIFSIALWRAFGTPLAIDTIGFRQVYEWDVGTQASLATELATACVQKYQEGERKQFCFTSAYGPPRIQVEDEINCLIESPDANVAHTRLLQLYTAVCNKVGGKIFNARWKLAKAAQQGPRKLTEAILSIFGGTGFSAKEIVEDVKMTSLFDSFSIPADSDWAVSGPGARRGLNRLHGRQVDHLVQLPRDEQKAANDAFLSEILQLWSARREMWPSKILNSKEERPDVLLLLKGQLAEELDCNDIQFQLCEVDKFFRALDAPADPDKAIEFLERTNRMFQPVSRY